MEPKTLRNLVYATLTELHRKFISSI